jgi:hypothetical protein
MYAIFISILLHDFSNDINFFCPLHLSLSSFFRFIAFSISVIYDQTAKKNFKRSIYRTLFIFGV